MSNEPNKPIPAQELTEKELESITGGVKEHKDFSRQEIEPEHFLVISGGRPQLINDGN